MVLELEAFDFGSTGVRTVYALVVDGRNEIRDCLDRYEGPAGRRLVAVMRWLAECSAFPKPGSFRHLGDQVYELKEHSVPLRLFCFL